MDRIKLKLLWLGWQDLNLRNAGIKIRCLTAWLHPNDNGAREGFWTLDLQDHNLALHQLSYSRHTIGAPGGTRTPDTRLRRPLLYPAELQAHVRLCVTFRLWSGWWESDPRNQLGRLVFYHWTTPALHTMLWHYSKRDFCCQILFGRFCQKKR